MKMKTKAVVGGLMIVLLVGFSLNGDSFDAPTPSSTFDIVSTEGITKPPRSIRVHSPKTRNASPKTSPQPIQSSDNKACSEITACNLCLANPEYVFRVYLQSISSEYIFR
eukprot:gene5341-15503_t